MAMLHAGALFPREMLKKLGTTYEESLARMEKSRRSPEEMTAFIEGIWRETAKAQREELDRIEQAASKVVESFGGNVINGIDISYGAVIEDNMYHCACDVLRCLSLLRSRIERGDAAGAAHYGNVLGRKLMLGRTMDLVPFIKKGIEATKRYRKAGTNSWGGKEKRDEETERMKVDVEALLASGECKSVGAACVKIAPSYNLSPRTIERRLKKRHLK